MDYLDDEVLNKTNKTEVFENFELIGKDQSKKGDSKGTTDKTKQSMIEVEQQRYPNTMLMSELKRVLRQRQEVIENDKNLVFKEFDPSKGCFVEITKEERDKKTLQLDQKLSEIKEQEKKIERQIEKERAAQRFDISEQSNPLGDLFAELRSKAK